MNDPVLDAMMADIAKGMTCEGDVVTLVSGTESCQAFFDDAETVALDYLRESAQMLDTAVRYRAGAITQPARDAPVILRWQAAKGQADTSYLVREVLADPGNPGMLRVALVAA